MSLKTNMIHWLLLKVRKKPAISLPENNAKLKEVSKCFKFGVNTLNFHFTLFSVGTTEPST